jgi:hypothetical protein
VVVNTGLGLFELAPGFWLVINGLRPEITTADRGTGPVSPAEASAFHAN